MELLQFRSLSSLLGPSPSLETVFLHIPRFMNSTSNWDFVFGNHYTEGYSHPMSIALFSRCGNFFFFVCAFLVSNLSSRNNTLNISTSKMPENRCMCRLTCHCRSLIRVSLMKVRSTTGCNSPLRKVMTSPESASITFKRQNVSSSVCPLVLASLLPHSSAFVLKSQAIAFRL